MARRPANLPPPPQRPAFTVGQLRRRIERLQRCIDELEAFEPQKVQKRYGEPEVIRLEAAIAEALTAAFGENTPAYNRYGDAARLDHGPHTMRISPAFGRGGTTNYDAQDAHDAQRYLSEGKVQAISLLSQAINTLKDEIADQAPSEQSLSTIPAPASVHNRKVFVVHGREEAPREAVARFLERLGFQAIILHEQANQGRTVIEKVESHSDVGFAVIILTPDDTGSLKGEVPQPRARQNVLLELGYFIGKLTRKRVCTFRVGEVEIPSDWRGVIDEPYDAVGAWKQNIGERVGCRRIRDRLEQGHATMNQLAPITVAHAMPALITVAGEHAARRFLEFFAANMARINETPSILQLRDKQRTLGGLLETAGRASSGINPTAFPTPVLSAPGKWPSCVCGKHPHGGFRTPCHSDWVCRADSGAKTA